MKIPPYLYHKTRAGRLNSILEDGLQPKKPEEWKGLIPTRHRNTPIVWLKENQVRRNLKIDTTLLNPYKLYKINIRDKRVNWWYYTGWIQPEAIEVVG